MPQIQTQREFVAKMKLIPIQDLISGKRLMLVDDSIVRGTQMKDTAEFLFNHGAKEVHVRSSCPPIMFGCRYLNFSRSTSDMDLIARRVLAARGVTDAKAMEPYLDPDRAEYERMVNDISAKLSFTSLRYNRLDDLIAATGLDECDLCTYCWNGKI